MQFASPHILSSPALLGALLLMATACDRAENGPPDTSVGLMAEATVPVGDADLVVDAVAQDEPIEPWQGHLLDLAFDSASKMPVDPHVKSRSRAQERVFDACIEMGLHDRALRYADQIGNWRKGAAYAIYVAHCAKSELPCDSERYLAMAREISAQTEGWRSDRIKNEIAAAHAWLGDSTKAEAFSSDLDESETGRINSVLALTSEEEDFEERLNQIVLLSGTGNFDLAKHALFSGVALHRRYYSAPERRDLVERVIGESWAKTPYNIRAEVLTGMAETALANGDSENALRLVGSAREMIAERTWNPDDYLPLCGPISAITYLAGDTRGGLELASEAIDYYEDRVRLVPNIYVAETLRPIAESYVRMGRSEEAMALYRRVLEAGVDNPNSVPRAEDLAETCTSMALYGVQPPRDLMDRMDSMQAELGSPW
jgi:tetratricopeptide (TPR) repeat protein